MTVRADVLRQRDIGLGPARRRHHRQLHAQEFGASGEPRREPLDQRRVLGSLRTHVDQEPVDEFHRFAVQQAAFDHPVIDVR